MTVTITGYLTETVTPPGPHAMRNIFVPLTGSDVGYYVKVLRLSQPTTWEQFGMAEFQILTDSLGYQGICTRPIYFGRSEIYLPPAELKPIRIRVRLHPVPWMSAATVETGIVANV